MEQRDTYAHAARGPAADWQPPRRTDSAAAHSYYAAPRASPAERPRAEHSARSIAWDRPFGASQSYRATAGQGYRADANRSYRPTADAENTRASSSSTNTSSSSSAYYTHYTPYTHYAHRDAASAYLPPAAASAPATTESSPKMLGDRAGRMHCYISGAHDGEHASAMAPPVLPPLLDSLHSGEREMPFWRPPPVLQRDPHYNGPASAAPHYRPLDNGRKSLEALAVPPRPVRRASRHTLEAICTMGAGSGNDGGCDEAAFDDAGSLLSGDTSSMGSSSPVAAPMAAREAMSIACLLSGGSTSEWAPRKRAKTHDDADADADASEADTAAAAATLHKLARTERRAGGESPPTVITYSSVREEPGLCAGNQVVITCYHAAVAQKSYGGEKRFLCPPPAVLMCGEGSSARDAHGSAMILSVAREGGDADADARSSSSAHAPPLECQTSFNERNVALFKSLHVTGMQKAKSFRLRLDLLSGTGSAPYVALESGAVTIISKPSKKTSKARNQSACIRAGALVSLFNRINSQTFRTKYLNVDHRTDRWVAQSNNWSPFHVEVVGAAAGAPLFYGSRIVLVESHRNFRSPPMIIRKVERGRLVPAATSPVSQMQKIALEEAVPASATATATAGAPRFLKADAGHYLPPTGASSDTTLAARFDDPDGSPELTFESPGLPADADGESTADLRMDDAFCWTIVGIAAFTHAYSVPPGVRVGSIPRVESITLDSARNELRVTSPAVVLGQDVALLLGGAALHADPQSSDTYSARLPAGTEGGTLALRRHDGSLFHSGWALRRSPDGLEVVQCSLDI
ncbi:hypothetical protein GGI07_000342 [Coemansia sp. Benny D115]|nr:hypothetical protein GGI07_000342 [Coemansia sp. Benny D115]